MGRPFSPHERTRYHVVRRSVRASMRSDGVTGAVTRADVSARLGAAGRPRSERYVSAVLDGERISRPGLRDVSAAIQAERIARRRAEALPDWL